MRPKTITRQLDTADPDGICESQMPAGAGALTLDGAFVIDGIAILDQQRRVLITSDGNDSGVTFTVTGTDYHGREISEVVTGPNATTATTTLDFKTVTSVTISAAATGNILVGTSGIGASQPIPLDFEKTPFEVTIGLEISGTIDVTVQYTMDDVLGYSKPVEDGAPFNWYDHADLTNITADDDGVFISPVTAMRLLTNSGTGTAVMRIVQAGRH